jgi:hypothetical protein
LTSDILSFDPDRVVRQSRSHSIMRPQRASGKNMSVILIHRFPVTGRRPARHAVEIQEGPGRPRSISSSAESWWAVAASRRLRQSIPRRRPRTVGGWRGCLRTVRGRVATGRRCEPKAKRSIPQTLGQVRLMKRSKHRSATVGLTRGGVGGNLPRGGVGITRAGAPRRQFGSLPIQGGSK